MPGTICWRAVILCKWIRALSRAPSARIGPGWRTPSAAWCQSPPAARRITPSLLPTPPGGAGETNASFTLWDFTLRLCGFEILGICKTINECYIIEIIQYLRHFYDFTLIDLSPTCLDVSQCIRPTFLGVNYARSTFYDRLPGSAAMEAF